MYFQIVLSMIKTRTGMICTQGKGKRNIKELLQQLRAKNSAIKTLSAIISRLEVPLALDIVGSNQQRRQP